MEMTYMIVIAIITYILGSITKIFVDTVPDKYIPLQNVVIGLISGLIVYFAGIESSVIQALVLCLTATMTAGGVYDLVNTNKEEE